MSKQPLVSIVTPSLNQGRFIVGTIESVLNQDYPNIEYLVLDGGSTDGTLQILRSYGSRLRYLSEPDNGQSAAINKGWKLSKGEIIAWLNSDDTYLPGAVTQVVSFFEAHPEIDAVYGDCDYIDTQGRFLRPYPTRPYDYLDLVKSMFNYIPQPATFMRRHVLETVGVLDESLHYVMDFDYWLRLSTKHKMAYLPKRLATLRLHQSAKSVKSVSRFGPELIRTYDRLFATPDLPPEVSSIKAKAMSNIYYRAASCCFWTGDIGMARHYALRAWSYSPRNLKRSLFLIMGLGSLGSLGLAGAKKLRRMSGVEV